MNTPTQTIAATHSAQNADFYAKCVPSYLYDALKQDFKIRPYQQEALGRFIHYFQEYNKAQSINPLHLLFHMATGSGKTLIMAASILYLYQQGYRNFLFFVNSSNIIDKTRDNFLNQNSSKYLFSNNIHLLDKQITIKEVSNFRNENTHEIQIVFSTIQGLHTRLNSPKENAITYTDFEHNRLVLISDEAHHINAETKRGNKLSKEEQSELISWEATVHRILNANQHNLLLEFTATADFSMPEIAAKYSNKLLFDYSLRQFRADGYSKEVKVLQTDAPAFERALQAILLSQYRKKVFASYGINAKPVVLFKSKTIKDSHSFFEEFVHEMQKLSEEKIRNIIQKSSNLVFTQILHFLEKHNISIENLILELQEDFSVDKLISVNSKEDSDEKQLAVNSLENESNPYRAIFAVDKLNEGWDVLNLFDIVRLYNTRDANEGKAGKTTMAEAQLIGRGARYFPFRTHENQNEYLRKFDEDTKHELRIGEELYYHSAYNPKYIQELNSALVQIGIKSAQTEELPIQFKPAFTQSDFYKHAYVFQNQKIKTERRHVSNLGNYLIQKFIQVFMFSGISETDDIFGVKNNEANTEVNAVEMQMSDLGEIIIRKALGRLPFFHFNHLQKYFPNLQSISQFIHSEHYLAGMKIKVHGTNLPANQISPSQKLDVCIDVLTKIMFEIEQNAHDYSGSSNFVHSVMAEVFTDKIVKSGNRINTAHHLNIVDEPWFAHKNDGFFQTDLAFLEFFGQAFEMLKNEFQVIFLIKNLNFVSYYNIGTGKKTDADYLLFLQKQDELQPINYQIFLHSKNFHLQILTSHFQDLLSQRHHLLYQTQMDSQEFYVFDFSDISTDANHGIYRG